MNEQKTTNATTIKTATNRRKTTARNAFMKNRYRAITQFSEYRGYIGASADEYIGRLTRSYERRGIISVNPY